MDPRERRQAVQEHLAQSRDGLARAASQPLAASEGSAGVPGSPWQAREAYRAAEGVEVRMSPSGGEIVQRWASEPGRPTYGRWLRIGGTDDGEWVEESEIYGWIELVPAVDTGADLDGWAERGARAMFAVTNRADDWADPSIPEDLREHYQRLARAVLEAR